jgi:HEAT repeat protein
MVCGMSSQDFKEIPTPALLQQAVALARNEPVLQSEDYWARIRALHFRAGQDVFEAAVVLCSAPDPISRAVGADILAQLGVLDGEYPFADESVPTLVSLLADTELHVAASALYALGHLKRGEPVHLARLAEHPSEDIRYALAYALGGRTDSVSIDTEIRLSGDQDVDCRNWATFALGALSELDSPAIREALAARLADADDEVRGEAIGGLAKRQDERAVDAILGELGKPDVMALAIEAAETMPRQAFLPSLERLQAEHPKDEDILRAVIRCRDAPESAR